MYAYPFTCDLFNKIQNEHMISVRVRVVAQVPVRLHNHLLNLSNISNLYPLIPTIKFLNRIL